MGKHSLPGYGSVASGNRLVRTRLLGGVGAGGEKPPATRLAITPISLNIAHVEIQHNVIGSKHAGFPNIAK
jgi:hypothetical protein